MLSDTSPNVLEAYRRRLKEMAPSERLDLGVALWQAGNSLQRAALRREHPDASDDELTFRVAASRFGMELARRVYGRQ